MSLFEKLPKLPFLGGSPVTEYFFALNIGQQKVTAGLWGVEGKKLQIVSVSEQKFKGLEGEIDYNDLAEAASVALDEVLADFEPEPTKILFGVPDFFLQDDDLKEEYLKVLRRLVKDLDVSPMAYVSTTHAITHLLQKDEGVPPTAILVGLSDPLVVTVVKAGKVEGSRVVKRTQKLAEDVQKALLGITNIEVLPARILLYGTAGVRGVHDLKDGLLSFPWMNKLPFLHLPKVDFLPDFLEIEAVCLAGASEVCPVVHYKSGNIHTEEVVESGESLLQERRQDLLEDVGFVSGDIESPVEDAYEDAVPDRHLPAEVHSNFPQGVKAKLPALPILTAVFRSRMASLQIVVPALVVLLAVLAVFSYVYFVKAHVTVFVDPRISEKEMQVTIDPGISKVDEEARKIPGKIVDTDLTGTEKGVASGKKQIGDPAKGSVVVYNKTYTPKIFSQGAVLVGPDNNTYVIDSTVNIASQSAEKRADEVQVITPGKANVSVTATFIGPDGNLPAGVELDVKGFSSADFSAKVDQALSGGTSKDVTVVTSDDQNRLLSQAVAVLRKTARDKLQEKLEGDLKVSEEVLSEQVIQKRFSKSVNDQASEFTVNVSLRFKGTAYSDMDLKSIMSKLVQVSVPEGYESKLDDAEIRSGVSKIEKDGTVVIVARYRAKLMPKLDVIKIKSEILGKRPEEAMALLKSMENVIDSEIKISPSLMGPLLRLPFFERNISVEVSAK